MNSKCLVADILLHWAYEPRETQFSIADVAAHSSPSEESLHKIFLRHKYCIFYLENSSSYYNCLTPLYYSIEAPKDHPVEPSCRFWVSSLKVFSKADSFIYASDSYVNNTVTSHFKSSFLFHFIFFFSTLPSFLLMGLFCWKPLITPEKLHFQVSSKEQKTQMTEVAQMLN